MAQQGIKRRSSSSSPALSSDASRKRQRSSPSRTISPIKKNRALPVVKVQRGVFQTVRNFVSSLIIPIAADPMRAQNGLPSSSSTSFDGSSGSTSQSPLESYPGGSLAMLAAADDSRQSYTPQTILPGDVGSSLDPIDFTEEDDVDDSKSVDGFRPSPQAGPSRLPASTNGPVLFPESFSSPPLEYNDKFTYELPSPANSQDVIDRKPLSSKIVKTQRQPSRPNVHVSPPPRGRLGWEERSASPISSTSSRASNRLGPKKKHRSNMRSAQQIEEIRRKQIRGTLADLATRGQKEGNLKLTKTAERLKNMFSGRGGTDSMGRQLEIAHKSFTQVGVNSSKAFYAVLLNGKKSVTIEEKTAAVKPSLFQLEHKQKIGQRAKEVAGRPSAFDLSEIGKSIVEEQLRKDKEIEERLKPRIPAKLSPEQDSVVTKNLSNPAFTARMAGSEVKAPSLRRLKPDTWLDDEVMNAYCDMMATRAKSIEAGARKVHWQNSFFYQKLSDSGYQGVRRWNRKTDLFAQDVMIFPINMGNMHWTACALNFENKRIEYYDSMGDGSRHRRKVFKLMREYLQAEHKEKKKTDFDLTGWTDSFNDNTPQQDNGSDCGVFSCQTLEMISRGRDLVKDGFEFSARNMPFFRRLMVWEIGQGKLEVRKWGNPAV